MGTQPQTELRVRRQGDGIDANPVHLRRTDTKLLQRVDGGQPGPLQQLTFTHLPLPQQADHHRQVVCVQANSQYPPILMVYNPMVACI